MIYAYTIFALLLAFAIDTIVGDPQRFPNPVRFFGWMTSKGTDRLLDPDLPSAVLVRRGAALSILIVFVAWAVPAAVLILCMNVNLWLWFFVETAFCWTIFAAKSLRTESVKIYETLVRGDLPLARKQLSMIVGRDTGDLDEQAIVKAVVETVAENTSDGVTAPMLYATIGGAPLGLAYKAVNTLDSMIGYKNNRYLYFGRFAAKMDDGWNYIPSRLTALFMICAAHLTGLDGRNAWRIYRRDRRNHASPNSAQTESVCAGALKIQLAGDASYYGQRVEKPVIGDAMRNIEKKDILRATRLMTVTSVLMLAAFSLAKLAILYLIKGGTLWGI